jgi:hypothetical protein
MTLDLIQDCATCQHPRGRRRGVPKSDNKPPGLFRTSELPRMLRQQRPRSRVQHHGIDVSECGGSVDRICERGVL